jgi:lipid II:glycine glycyltransferase (peptidoglycan interpeptide bridge formation enzyme)
VDLAHASEEALLESFGKNPRRHIRKAMREGMVVERTVDERDFVAFGEAHRSMTARKRLDALPDGFATEVMLPLARAGQGDLFVARYRDVPRNYLFLGTTRDPIYHWGALTEAAKEEGCPQTGQILHYAAMCHYRRLGKPVYDFGGSPGPVPEPTHPNFTVWKFKHEFNGRYVRYLGQWRRTLRPVDSALLEVVRRGMTLRRRLAGR